MRGEFEGRIAFGSFPHDLPEIVLKAWVHGHAHRGTETALILDDDATTRCLLPFEIGLKELEEILRYLHRYLFDRLTRDIQSRHPIHPNPVDEARASPCPALDYQRSHT